MSEISGKLTYDQFVNNLLLKLNRDEEDRLRIMRIVMDGMLQLDLHYLKNTKVAKLSIDTDINAIHLPSDFLVFLSLGVPWKGRLWEFTRDNQLITTTDGTEGVDETLDVDDGEGINVADNGVIVGYGSRGGVNNYYYRIDKKRDRIAFSGFEPDHVVLEYISSGIDDTETNYIGKDSQRCLEYFTRFMLADYDGAPESRIRTLEIRYEKESIKLKKLLAPTIRDIKDAWYKSTSRSLLRS